MKGLDKDSQREMLSEKAGRQILVALHEATLGKPFSDIVFDEYNSIASHEAKSLYLTVCIMHRIGIAARAGLISRVHGIPFTSFKNNLFAPLEHIVFARENRIIGDYQYQTRHPQVAEMVLIPRLNKPLISNYFEPHENFSNYFNRNRLGRFRFVFRSSSDWSGIRSMLR